MRAGGSARWALSSREGPSAVTTRVCHRTVSFPSGSAAGQVDPSVDLRIFSLGQAYSALYYVLH